MDASLTRLSPVLPDHVWPEIQHVASQIAEESLVFSGSYVEGLANPNSDVDLYAITDAHLSSQKMRFRLRETHYVGVEYVRLTDVARLRDRLREPTWSELIDLGLSELGLYYRLAIGIPIRVSSMVSELLQQFDKTRACENLRRFALVRAYEYSCRVALARELGASRETSLLMREGFIWSAVAQLAAEREGYPSLKWTAEKAARRYGRGTPAFHEIVDDFTRFTGSLDQRLEKLRGKLAVPREVRELLLARGCRLADGVQLLGSGAERYLKRSDGLTLRVTGLISNLCDQLASGRSWQEILVMLEDTLDPESVVALLPETPYLRPHQMLVPSGS